MWPNVGSRSEAPHRRARLATVAAGVAILAAACSTAGQAGGPSPSGSPGSPSPSPSGSPLSRPALQLAVLEAVGGHLIYCDPDQYPVSRGDALENAKARMPQIRADRAAFDAILAREGFSADHLTDADLIQINEDFKQMQAIRLAPSGDGYAFDVSVPQRGSDVGVWDERGTVTPAGAVRVTGRRPGKRPLCPICLVTGTMIATPGGAVPVQDVRPGMRVWSSDRRGRLFAATVLETGWMVAPVGHVVVRLTFADGRTVTVSPGHRTADGRSVGELRPGDVYEGSPVTHATLLPYQGFTWDLLPSGPTGTYLANGVLLGSTLGGDGRRSRLAAAATRPTNPASLVQVPRSLRRSVT